MFRFVVLCHVLFAGWQHAAGSPNNEFTDYEYVREANTWLRLHLVPATWSDAAVRCQLEGGVLATPTSSALADAMTNSMDRYRLGSSNVFIGATNRFSKGDFKSLNGETLADSLGWSSVESDNNGDCLSLTSAGALTHVSCTRVLPYFCSRNTDNNDNRDYYGNNDRRRCDGNGYQYEPRTGSCYKFHGYAHSWRPALEICYKEGGYLSIINSRTEASVLRDLYNKYADTTAGAQEAEHAFVGFTKFSDGIWGTIYGVPIAEAGYADWDDGEPSNADRPGFTVENCGTIHKNGKLNNGVCQWKSPFICEINPSERTN